MCHPCIKRLNIAYSFKKQCVQSAGVLKNYIELVKKSQEKSESPNAIKPESILSTPSGAYMLLPNQKYVKILVGPQNQGANTFQNVFLNLIPATTLTPVASPSTISEGKNTAKTKDTNQNVFLNLNNTFQKFIPIATPVSAPTISTTTAATIPAAVEVTKKVIPHPIKSPPPLSIPSQNLNVNVNQLLTESKSEEVSVEIDPTVFGLEGDDDDEDSDEDDEMNDYDEVISSAKITLKDFKPNGEKIQNGKDDAKFVPILPKQHDDFLTSGQHFLFGSSGNNTDFVCESCQKSFSSKRLLKVHFTQFHLGKMPFKCEFCYVEYVTRMEYENCRKNHHTESEGMNNKSLTLEDFANNSQNSDISLLDEEAIPSENGEYFCDVCNRSFNSTTGLLRHKVRKHNQKNRKKYFIKGMKNARCDICNRDFSTQSYMQLHRKLHLRDDIGYKYKVFGKSKYGDVENLMKDEEKVEKEKSTSGSSSNKSEEKKVKDEEEEEGEVEDSKIKSEECDILEPEIKMEVDEQSENEIEDDEDSNPDEQIDDEKIEDDDDDNNENNKKSEEEK